MKRICPWSTRTTRKKVGGSGFRVFRTFRGQNLVSGSSFKSAGLEGIA
jgi:hypothetical protein